MKEILKKKKHIANSILNEVEENYRKMEKGFETISTIAGEVKTFRYKLMNDALISAINSGRYILLSLKTQEKLSLYQYYIIKLNEFIEDFSRTSFIEELWREPHAGIQSTFELLLRMRNDVEIFLKEDAR